MMVDIYSVGPEFFELYGIPILRGRTFDAAGPDAQVLVGERFANALWPDTDPLGQSFTFEKERFEVIGIVGEIHHPSLDATLDGPEFYTRFTGVDAGAVLSLRCEGPCPDAALVRQRLRAVHPDLVVVDARRVEDDYFAQIAQPRAAAALGFAFAAIALLAAAAGLFSVLTYSVARRRREFGIRIALGASSRELHRLVLRESLIVALSGIAIGAVASWMLARHLATLQYGVTISDPGSWTAVAGLIAATTLFASWRPARAASNIDPVLLLKEQ
jgi:ABC-type lipoprotein release transport system permease subunit